MTNPFSLVLKKWVIGDFKDSQEACRSAPWPSSVGRIRVR